MELDYSLLRNKYDIEFGVTPKQDISLKAGQSPFLYGGIDDGRYLLV